MSVIQLIHYNHRVLKFLQLFSYSKYPSEKADDYADLNGEVYLLTTEGHVCNADKYNVSAK